MKLPAQPLRVNAVAYVISSSLEEDPSPYPWCRRLIYRKFLISDVLYRQIADAGYGAFELGLAEEV
jgi:hypothetical protein